MTVIDRSGTEWTPWPRLAFVPRRLQIIGGVAGIMCAAGVLLQYRRKVGGKLRTRQRDVRFLLCCVSLRPNSVLDANHSPPLYAIAVLRSSAIDHVQGMAGGHREAQPCRGDGIQWRPSGTQSDHKISSEEVVELTSENMFLDKGDHTCSAIQIAFVLCFSSI